MQTSPGLDPSCSLLINTFRILPARPCVYLERGGMRLRSSDRGFIISLRVPPVHNSQVERMLLVGAKDVKSNVDAPSVREVSTA